MRTVNSKDGTTLAYDVYGSGPALIYITGASCFRNFKPVVMDAKGFAMAFTVYNYDRRGRGDSSDMQPYAIEREVEDIEALIDAAGGEAYLYGHSSGAVLALEAALRLGAAKVKKAVLYDPSYVHDEEAKRTYGQLSGKVKGLLAEGRNKAAMKRFLKGIGMPGAFVALLPLFPGWSTMAALAPTLAYDIALTEDLPPLERAAQAAVPMLILAGEKSPAGVRDVSRRLAKAIPGARYGEMAGQNHMVGAKALLPELTRFLKP